MMNPEPAAPLIRDRRPDDLEAIAGLAHESMAWHADNFADIRPAPTKEDLLNGYRQRTDSDDGYFRVAEVGGSVVAFLTAQVNQPPDFGIERYDGPFVFISDVAVAGSARRQGIARALLTDLEAWADQHGATTIKLNMAAANGPARQLYESLGYHPAWVSYRKNRHQVGGA